MHTLNILSASTTLLLLLPLTVLSAPAPAPTPAPAQTHTFYDVNFKSTNLCADSTFTDLTTPVSALVSDCKKLHHTLKTVDVEHGYRLVGWNNENKNDDHKHLGLVSEGSCVFGVRVKDLGYNGLPVITRGDVADILRDAIFQFEKGGRVAAKGDVKCMENWVYDDWKVIEWEVFSWGEERL
ncbi:putative necrosis-inducing factor-domain-containing protein [Poronia punctata]|nr:putative necrosis-inducing factor-domain-containing protein [Poronia punctata]